MFVWGSNVYGCLGLGGIEKEVFFIPTSMDCLETKAVIKVALGKNHTLFLTDDGKVYSCGSNDYCQLGHEELTRRRPHLVSKLSVQHIVSVACGSNHSLALNRWGQVFAWGSDYEGQLGLNQERETYASPQLVKLLSSSYNIVQIAAGQRHSVALSNDGFLLTWGANDFNQLGLGSLGPFVSIPTVVSSLIGIPFAFIACGDNHSFAISKSCSVYGWGQNNKGQLGPNEDGSREKFPRQMRTLRNRFVRYISCGVDFSTFLTQSGGVFSCGAGVYGQLGHGNNSDEMMPRQVVELMGRVVTQVACGRQHSLAYVPANGVYSYGLGSSGQLGFYISGNVSSPHIVNGPWASNSENEIISGNSKSSKVFKSIFAGGDQSVVLTTDQTLNASEANDFRIYSDDTQILTLTLDTLLRCTLIDNNTPVDQDLMMHMEVVFRSLACLNGSFLLQNDGHFNCDIKNHGVDMNKAEEVFALIARLKNTSLKELIHDSIIKLIGRLSARGMHHPDVETLRIYLILPLYHEFNNPMLYLKLHLPFAVAVVQLNAIPQKIIGQWWCSMSSEYFKRLVLNFKSFVLNILREQRLAMDNNISSTHLLSAMSLLKFLHNLNCSQGMKVPYDTFVVADLNSYLEVGLTFDFHHWKLSSARWIVYMCDYPFIFDTQSKIQLLSYEQALQMCSARHANYDVIVEVERQNQIYFFVLEIRRDCIVHDVVTALSRADPREMKKPLRVIFQGEEALDVGGVRKEFFFVLIREIFNPIYGMFREYTETNTLWFSRHLFDDSEAMLHVVGIVCGLAIYNSVIIHLPFPLALYKKLLGEPVGLADFYALSPVEARGLQDILDYSDEDFQDVFILYFALLLDGLGAREVVDLIPNGSEIAVTQENKHEYVKLYVDYFLNTSIVKQYEAFQCGFMKMCGGDVIHFFLSHELMACVIGNENYDWDVFKSNASYVNYRPNDRTILWFWEVFSTLSSENKKKFLFFLTGSERIPYKGMSAVTITIQRMVPTDRIPVFLLNECLPVAHTCFNTLELPEYYTKEILQHKLIQAIQHTEKFGLI